MGDANVACSPLSSFQRGGRRVAKSNNDRVLQSQTRWESLLWSSHLMALALWPTRSCVLPSGRVYTKGVTIPGSQTQSGTWTICLTGCLGITQESVSPLPASYGSWWQQGGPQWLASRAEFKEIVCKKTGPMQSHKGASIGCLRGRGNMFLFFLPVCTFWFFIFGKRPLLL